MRAKVWRDITLSMEVLPTATPTRVLIFDLCPASSKFTQCAELIVWSVKLFTMSCRAA